MARSRRMPGSVRKMVVVGTALVLSTWASASTAHAEKDDSAEYHADVVIDAGAESGMRLFFQGKLEVSGSTSSSTGNHPDFVWLPLRN